MKNLFNSFYPYGKVTFLSGMIILFFYKFMQDEPPKKSISNPPNIVFILTDDQRWDMLGCAGNPIISTPNIDKLAEKGVRFSHAFVTTPICAASRASILTGLYERTHDFTFKKPPVKKKYTDISYPYLLKKAGYRTGFVGKFGVKMEASIDSIFSSEIVNGFPYWKEVEGKKKYLTDIQGEQAIQFIQESVNKGPFCLSVSFSAPHADDDSKEQYFWPPALDSLYASVRMPVPSTARKEFYDSLPDFLKGTMSRERWYWRFDTPEKFQQMVKGYYRMITAIDQTVGSITDELNKLGVAENTIIIFMGDNGYYLSDRGYADKWLMHDVSIRVPLIIYDPRKSTAINKTLDQMVLNIDVAPTILNLAGIPIPGRMQGKSLLPLMKGNINNWRDSIFCEHLMDEPKIPNSECIRTKQWKFVRYPKHPEYIELYNLTDDPWEEHNLAYKKVFQKKIVQFQIQCDNRIKQLMASR
ncbi:MAG: sulfatase [Saprospiraceae bacterium]